MREDENVDFRKLQAIFEAMQESRKFHSRISDESFKRFMQKVLDPVQFCPRANGSWA